MDKKKRKAAGIAAAAAVLICLLCSCGNSDVNEALQTDHVRYEGRTYTLLEYPHNILFYDLHQNLVCEEGETVPVESNLWELVYCDGDLYCRDDQCGTAEAYYADESHFDWFVTIEEDDTEQNFPLELTDAAIQYLYSLDDAEKECSFFFEEIELFGTLKKISKDGIVQARTQLAYLDGSWYWRTERIDEQREKEGSWGEYMQELPAELFPVQLKRTIVSQAVGK